MAYDTTITLRTNNITKKKAQKLFGQLGMDLSTAINLFLNRSINTNSIPFEVSLEQPNKETMAAIDEIYNHSESTIGPFNTVDELMEYLDAQD